MSSSSLATLKKHWWLSNRKLAEKHLSNARLLLGSQETTQMCSAIDLLDAALSLRPHWEKALELKARALLYLRKFKDVANMLQEHIPSFRGDDIPPSESSLMSREKVKLLSSYGEDWKLRPGAASLKCFCVSKLKEKLLAGLSRGHEREEWRYLVLGQACCHLGMMEDALILLQSGKRAASAAFRKESICWNDDSFCSENLCASESEIVSHLLGNIKFLLRRRAAALAALDAGLYSESVRHFSKILDGKRGTPQGFIAECYMFRATVFGAWGRVTDSIADCNRTLALDPTCLEALTTRASLFELVRCFSESLQDLEHLKLLYESILRHQKFPGPAWKHHKLNFRDIQGNLQFLTGKIQDLRQRLASSCVIDYYTLIGLTKGCTRADVERAHLLLCLRHRPDKASHFVDRCEFVDDRDIEAVKDQARLSALMLYRLLQKAYTHIMTSIMEEDAERQKQLRANEATREEPDRQAGTVPNQRIQVTVESSSDAGTEWKQLGRCTESQSMSSGLVSSDLKRRDAIRSDRPKVLLSTSSATGWTLMNAAASGMVEAPSSGDASSEFSIYGPVKEDSSLADLTDSAVFQGVSCRDLAAVGTILSHGFPSDGWMNAHQGHTMIPLPVTYEALSC